MSGAFSVPESAQKIRGCSCRYAKIRVELCPGIPASVITPFFFSSRRRHTRLVSDWSSDVCSSDLLGLRVGLCEAEAQSLLPRFAFDQVQAARVGRGDAPRLGEDEVEQGIEVALRAERHADVRELGDLAARSEERRVGQEWRAWGSR